VVVPGVWGGPACSAGVGDGEGMGVEFRCGVEVVSDSPSELRGGEDEGVGVDGVEDMCESLVEW
jgi:hypothetical protein